jgi:hypothetical protein
MDIIPEVAALPDVDLGSVIHTELRRKAESHVALDYTAAGRDCETTSPPNLVM